MTESPKPADGASYVWLNGQIMSSNEATVRTDDGGWLHGAGLFETILAQNARTFRLEAHIERLRASAHKLLRPIERDELPTEDNISDLLQATGIRHARIRLTVSAGPMKPTDENDIAPTVCMTATPFSGYPAPLYQSGATVLVSRAQQSPTDPLAGHKTISYLPRLLSLREAHKAKCLEAIWLTTSHEVAEGAISNLFVVNNDGKLQTPKLDTPVLPGILRSVVLEVARKAAVDVEETSLNINDLLDAREVFLTNVIMQVMPVTNIERHTVGDGTPGATTQKLMLEVTKQINRECELP
ncbi:MAG: aminotransferase class IV [Phycisphaerae bacterium]